MIRKLLHISIVLCAGFAGGILGSLAMQMYPLAQNGPRVALQENFRAASDENDPSDLISKISRSIVRIVDAGVEPMRHKGFGALVSSDGWLIFPGQIPAKKISVLDSENRSFGVKKIIYHPGLNVSFIQSTLINGKQVELLDKSKLTNTFNGFILKGFSSIEPLVVTSVGYPFSRVLAGPLKPNEYAKRFNYDQRFTHEQSGVFTDEGVLVGFTGEYGIIPVSSVREILPLIFKNKELELPTVPISYYDLAWRVRDGTAVPAATEELSSGALLFGTSRTSYRLKSKENKIARLYGGDIITAVNGERIDRNRGLADIVQQYRVGDSITFSVVKKNKKEESQITIILESIK